MASTLYIVALPIGQSRDITLRALDILRHVDVVAAEDTRSFQKLAQTLDLQVKKLVSHHDHNEEASSEGLLALLEQDQSVALTVEAGTPGISDPGYRLVKKAHERNIRVVPVPGASAVTSALSVAPFGGKTFFFGGFLSSKQNQRRKELDRFSNSAERLVFYEAPHRVVEHLRDAAEILKDSRVCVLRELTKEHEEIFNGTIQDAYTHFTRQTPRGEFVMIYQRNLDYADDLSLDIENEILENLNQGTSVSEVAKLLQNRSTLPRKALYNLVLKLSQTKKS